MKKSISVIIVTYNAERYIKRALDSVVNSKNDIFDCIVVDGQSKDHTVEIVKEYRNKIKLQYISEKDSGIFDALNKGVKMTSSDYIYVLGADDELIPGGLADLIEKSGNEDVVYGKVIDRDEYGNLYFPRAKSYHMLKRNMPFSHQGMIMKNALIKKLGGFDIRYRLCADFDLVQRAYIAGASFKYVDCVVAYFSTEGTSRLNLFSVDSEVRSICIKNGLYKYFSFRHVYYMTRKLIKSIYLKIKSSC